VKIANAAITAVAVKNAIAMTAATAVIIASAHRKINAAKNAPAVINRRFFMR